MTPPIYTQSFESRSKTHKTPLGRHLLQIMHQKQSNLCLSIDLTDPQKILETVDLLGPKICILKTHIDIIEFPATSDSTLTIPQFTAQLTHLSQTHNFLIFEDRKFADIGHTVTLQYTKGIYRISSWAHIVNAHTLPGPGIISGLKAGLVSSPDTSTNTTTPSLSTRAILLLHQMSSSGNLFTPEYHTSTVTMARHHRDFVIGFISQGAVPSVQEQEASHSPKKPHLDLGLLSQPCTSTSSPSIASIFDPQTQSQTQEENPDQEDWITMTPGVNISCKGDALGQQYNTPEYIVGEKGSDIIIVGRGIYGAGSGGPDGAKKVLETAEEYRRRAWGAYEARVGR